MERLNNKKLAIYTDAGWKDGVSTHHWRIINEENGIVEKRRSFKSTEENSQKAELQTLNSLLQYLSQRDKGDVTIYTDCYANVALFNNPTDRNDINVMKWIMKDLNIDVKWVSRETKQIKLADYYCSQLMSTVLNRKEYGDQLSI